jgi:hypothetical protein
MLEIWDYVSLKTHVNIDKGLMNVKNTPMMTLAQMF